MIAEIKKTNKITRGKSGGRQHPEQVHRRTGPHRSHQYTTRIENGSKRGERQRSGEAENTLRSVFVWSLPYNEVTLKSYRLLNWIK